MHRVRGVVQWTAEIFGLVKLQFSETAQLAVQLVLVVSYTEVVLERSPELRLSRLSIDFGLVLRFVLK